MIAGMSTKSGYDSFAGPEGLRGLCLVQSVCEDDVHAALNSIPPPLQYPSTGVDHLFAQGLIRMFYSIDLMGKLQGLMTVIKYSILRGVKQN